MTLTKKKLSIIIILCICLCGSLLMTDPNMIKTEKSYAADKKTEVKALWIGYCDYYQLGLSNKSKKTFTANTAKILNRAKSYGTNTIYFHVRAFDDAAYKSNIFKASKYLTSKASSSKKAKNTYSYDPLQIFITEAHKRGMELHAWMNPYRISFSYYLDPGQASSTKRIKAAVNEVLKYDVDGIHFDDYFYTASKGYKKVGSSKKYKVKISAAKKRSNVNKMVKQIYAATHKKKGAKFGISPAGNLENCMSMGADINTWLSKSGYVDYIVPQIYWTDNWGSRGNVSMFTDRLKAWKKKNKNNTDMYIGLALYRAGRKASDDKGWGRRNTNIRTQVKKLRAYGMEGYALFSAPDLSSSVTYKERYYLKGLVKPVKAKSIKFSTKSVSIKKGKKKTLKVKYNPSNTNPKSVKYKSSNSKVASISAKGVVKGKKKGKVTVTARTSNGKIAKCTVRVRK